jgi:hypothetical protein
MSTFPPKVPDRLKNKITVEVVDENTIKVKLKDGTVLQTVTKAEYEAAFKYPTKSQG